MAGLCIIGIGGGGRDGMTRAAYDALSRADVIVGYVAYTNLVAPLFPGKPVRATGMTRERERCEQALRMAADGASVALVCSGDAGVYGMASLVYEIAAARDVFSSVPIEVVAGVTAALGGAALLGAPLAHDFCVISLSDRLTAQETIERRLRSAAAGDFCIALYNPRSAHRPGSLRRACDVLLEALEPGRPCGWARNVGRAGEESRVCSLADLARAELDMSCTAFVGNSATRVVEVGGRKRLVTPRGYLP